MPDCDEIQAGVPSAIMTKSRYKQRKAYFDGLLTLFGRKPVLEALENDAVTPVCLHLAERNSPSPELDQMIALTQARGGEVKSHTREALSRISRHRRQDQGVAIDVQVPGYQPLQTLLESEAGNAGVIAVDNVTNPQNLGMIIRTVGASPRAGLLLAREGNARIDGLVVKASAGTLFGTRIYHCTRLPQALAELKQAGYRIYGLDGSGAQAIDAPIPPGPHVLVLGNETHGLSEPTRALCDAFIRIPLAAGIESLNVSVAAGIVAFAPLFCGDGR